MSNSIHHVKVPQEYFAKAKTEYTDWTMAFLRELIQNAWDAGASSIDFNIAPHNFASRAVQTKVLCVDNGCGMNYDTLINAFLSMGGSQKLAGSIGGFGYAKNIILFAHHSYKIRTQDQLVEGVGGQFTINTCASQVKGTQIEVVIEALPNRMQDKLTEYCSRFFAHYDTDRADNFQITLNGKPLELDSEYENEMDTPLGKLWWDKDTTTQQQHITVCQAGLPLFKTSRYGNTGLHGVLNLPVNSLNKLTANRDQLRGDTQFQLNELLDDLQTSDAVKMGQTITMLINPTAGNTKMVFDYSGGLNQMEAARIASSDLMDSLIQRVDFAKLYSVNFALKVEDVSRRKAASSKLSLKQITDTLNQVRIQKFYLAWRVACLSVMCCEYATTTLGVKWDFDITQYLEDDDEPWLNLWREQPKAAHGKPVHLGFVFADQVEGLHSVSSTYTAIYVNPMLMADDWMLGDLIDLALHEVTHFLVRAHGENFNAVEAKLRKSWRRCWNESEVERVLEGLKRETKKGRSS